MSLDNTNKGFEQTKDLLTPVLEKIKATQKKLKEKPPRKIKSWQILALKIIDYFPNAEDKRGSIFRVCKLNERVARIAFSDCKELNKRSIFYFFKMFSIIKNNQNKWSD